jgi:hypothetical protein
MIIHFSGLEGLDKPGVFVFPRLLVCTDCGRTGFTVPETALAELANGIRKSVPKTSHSVTQTVLESDASLILVGATR